MVNVVCLLRARILVTDLWWEGRRAMQGRGLTALPAKKYKLKIKPDYIVE